jgi:SPP1 gp7 family putative phage head morphogenesis protein
LQINPPSGGHGAAEGVVGAIGEAIIPNSIITKFLKGIYDQSINDGTIDPALWKNTWKQLFASFQKGYGKSLAKIKYNVPDYEYLQQLKFNTAVFSAFKQNEQIKEAASLLLKEDGSARTWKEFLGEAMKVDEKYNKVWLQTEYNQAHTTALQARRWRDAEKTRDLYPNLIFVAVMDQRTRDSHAKLHGTIRSINDSFWNKYSPPLDWGCRCSLQPTDKEATEVPEKLPSVPAGMDVNTGKEAKIFSDKHPYIKGSSDKKDELIKFVKSQLGE